MNAALTLHVLGGLLLFLAATLLTPIPFSIWYRDGQWLWFLLSAGITAGVGGWLLRRFSSRDEVTLREGFAIVTFAWLAFALFGGLPYVLSRTLPNPADAFFESMSGFTTTGASVFTNIEAVPASILFWRALTQWLGGMGIIVLSLAILPLLGVGGMQLFEAEAPGPTADRLTPRIADTARLLWGVYAFITAAGIVLLWVGEMDFFDSVCHTFTAISTGGFSTRNASLGAYGTYSQIVLIVVMVLGGANFSLHYYALRGRVLGYWRSDECRFYLFLLVGITLAVFLVNWMNYENPLINLRDSAFTVTSVLTTTGFATADYERWPFASQGLLVALMFIGGCTGSTAGGLKAVRITLLVKHAFLQLTRLIHPRQVLVLKLDHRPVPGDIMQDVLGFTVLFLGVLLIAGLLVAASGSDLLTASTAALACLTTVGPGLGGVGPMDNYASLPAFAKLVLSLTMLLGRLEVSTVLVLLFASFWKK
ncbi:MAG TPA: TrkH family potassium uptake protein [Pirellulaceae bacterium]|nr:TrkH family potassium uptake protein [Pirellulaceae bacterium]